MVFVMSLILVAVGLVGMFILVVFVSWLAIRFLRGQKTGEVVTAKGENDALLLFGDEELGEEREDEKRRCVGAKPQCSYLYQRSQGGRAIWALSA